MEVFNFRNNYTLENDRVKLVALSLDDISKVSKFSLEEPELWKYSLLSANGIENLKNYIDIALKGREDGSSYPFLVFDKKFDKVAGSTRFYDFQEVHKTVQLGYTWYGKDFQGTGLNKNCKYLLLEFAFEKLNLHRVEFRADANNARSIAAMKSLGCTVEGILRSNCAAGDERRDSIVLSILKDEWFGSVKENLLTKIKKEKEIFSKSI